MNEENITENKSAAEPRFKVGDVVWAPKNGLVNDNPMFMECRILALNYVRENGKSVFVGFRLITDDNESSQKPEAVFATKEECEAFIDSVIVPTLKRA